MQATSVPPKLDNWVWRPTAYTVATVALLVFFGGLPGPLNILVDLLAVVACAVVALLLAVSACTFAWQRRPRRAASALLALATPALLLFPMIMALPYVHLGLMLAFGIGFIGPAPLKGQPVEIYDWSTGMVGGPNTFLIHDTANAMTWHGRNGAKALPPLWRENDLLRDCARRMQHLIGHYYLCSD